MSPGQWWEATRPKTLPAAVAPVVAGTAAAWGAGASNLWAAGWCLLFALLLQVGTNFANDYYDFIKGADRPGRKGPVRASASGLVEPRVMKRAAAVVFLFAFLAGLQLIWFGGWWLLPLGIICLLSGWAYTAGPFPLAYNGLGDLFVFIFFGLVAVNFTYFVQTGAFSYTPFLISLGVGFLAANILIINNVRDFSDDKKSRKRTLAVLLGIRFSQWQFIVQGGFAFMVPLILAAETQKLSPLWPLLAMLPFVMTTRCIGKVHQDIAIANQSLARSGATLAMYGLLWIPAFGGFF